MPEYTLNIDLTLQGPILTHSTSARASGIDSQFAVNSDGHYFLPRTLIKGRLRQAWIELHSAVGTKFNPDIKLLLGEPSENSSQNSNAVEPKRGCLLFEDFVDNSTRVSNTRYRINIDEDRGSVKRGAYQVLEAPYNVDEQVTFTGKIHFHVPDQDSADNIKRDIEIGLQWITNLGAERTVGFGRLLNVMVTLTNSTISESSQVITTGADILDLKIIPSSAFCISRRRISNNLFKSEAIIPGVALKGSLASTWRSQLGLPPHGAVTAAMDDKRHELSKYFEKIRFTHAFPAPNDKTQRPVMIPLSLVEANGRFYDVALYEKPDLVGDPPVAPIFAVDWKNRTDVEKLFGWFKPERELRVRTAIDLENRKAMNEQLFAYEMIIPKGAIWYSQLDLSAVPQSDRTNVEFQLRDLFRSGLKGLGKTKTHAEIYVYDRGTISPKYKSNNRNIKGTWVITLQTPALLCDPKRINQSDLMTAYRDVWMEHSHQSITLKRFFAQQSLAGGLYLYQRFQPGKEYSPWLLTDAGSVFVVEAIPGQESQAQSHIDEWLVHGLPLPAWAVTRYGDHWSTCPFIRHGGYGEIAVNLDIHLIN